MHLDPSPLQLPCACTSLRKAARAVSRIYDDALASVGMTATQLAILRAIDRAGEGGAALSQLAEGLVMEKTTLYRGLGPLLRLDWIEVAAAAKGRAKFARLTPIGRLAMERAAEPWERAQTRVVEAFGPARWAALQPDIAALAEAGVRLQD
jgi:DNA-binding MarR family transcriptional regulator